MSEIAGFLLALCSHYGRTPLLSKLGTGRLHPGFCSSVFFSSLLCQQPELSGSPPGAVESVTKIFSPALMQLHFPRVGCRKLDWLGPGSLVQAGGGRQRIAGYIWCQGIWGEELGAWQNFLTAWRPPESRGTACLIPRAQTQMVPVSL